MRLVTNILRVLLCLALVTSPELRLAHENIQNSIRPSVGCAEPWATEALNPRSLMAHAASLPLEPYLVAEKSGLLRRLAGSRVADWWELNGRWVVLGAAAAGAVIHFFFGGAHATVTSGLTLAHAGAGAEIIVRYLLCSKPDAVLLLAAHMDSVIAQSQRQTSARTLEAAADALIGPVDHDPFQPALMRAKVQETLASQIGKSPMPAIYFVHPPEGAIFFQSKKFKNQQSAILWNPTSNALYISYPALQRIVNLGEAPGEVAASLATHAFAHLHYRELIKSDKRHARLVSDGEEVLMDLQLDADPNYNFDRARAAARDLTPEGFHVSPARQPIWMTNAYTELRYDSTAPTAPEPESMIDESADIEPAEDDARTAHRINWLWTQAVGHRQNGLSLRQELRKAGWSMRMVYQPQYPRATCSFGDSIAWNFVFIHPVTRRRFVLGPEEMHNPRFGLLEEGQIDRLKKRHHDRVRRINTQSLLLPSFISVLRSRGVMEALLKDAELERDPDLRLQAMAFARLAFVDRSYPLSPLPVFQQMAVLGDRQIPLTPEAMLHLVRILRRLFEERQFTLADRRRIPTEPQILVARMASAQRQLLAGSPEAWNEPSLVSQISLHLRELSAYAGRVVTFGRWIHILRDPFRPGGIGKTEDEIHSIISFGSQTAASGRAINEMAHEWDLDLSQMDYAHVDIAPRMLQTGTAALHQEGSRFRSVTEHIADVRNGLPFLKDKSVDVIDTGLLGSFDSVAQIARFLTECSRVLDDEGYLLLMTRANLPRELREALRVFGFELLSESDPRLSMTSQGLSRVAQNSAARRKRLENRFGNSYMILVKTKPFDPAALETLRTQRPEIFAALAQFADVRRRPRPEDPEPSAQPTDVSLLPLRYDLTQSADIPSSVIYRDEMRQRPWFANFDDYLACLLWQQQEHGLRDYEIPLLADLVAAWDDPNEQALPRRAVEWAVGRMEEPLWRRPQRGTGTERRPPSETHEERDTEVSVATGRRAKGPALWTIFSGLTNRADIVAQFRPEREDQTSGGVGGASQEPVDAEAQSILESLHPILPAEIFVQLTRTTIRGWLQAQNPEHIRIALQMTGVPLTPEQLGQTLTLCGIPYRQTQASQRREILEAANLWTAEVYSSKMDPLSFSHFESVVENILGVGFSDRAHKLARTFYETTLTGEQKTIIFLDLIRAINRDTLQRAALRMKAVNRKGKTLTNLQLMDPLRTQTYFIANQNISVDHAVELESIGSDTGQSGYSDSYLGDSVENRDNAYRRIRKDLREIWPSLDQHIRQSQKSTSVPNPLDLRLANLARIQQSFLAFGLQDLDESGLLNRTAPMDREFRILKAFARQLGLQSFSDGTADSQISPVHGAHRVFRENYVRPRENNARVAILEDLSSAIPRDIEITESSSRFYIFRILFAHLHVLRDNPQAEDYIAWVLNDFMQDAHTGKIDKDNVDGIALLCLFGLEIGIPAPTLEQWQMPNFVSEYIERTSQALLDEIQKDPGFLKRTTAIFLRDIYTMQLHLHAGGRVDMEFHDPQQEEQNETESKPDVDQTKEELRTLLSGIVPSADDLAAIVQDCLVASSPRDLALILESRLVSVMTPSLVQQIFELLGQDYFSIYPVLIASPNTLSSSLTTRFGEFDESLHSIFQTLVLTSAQFETLCHLAEQQFGFPLPSDARQAALAAIQAPDTEQKKIQVIEFLSLLNRDYFFWRGAVMALMTEIGIPTTQTPFSWAPVLPSSRHVVAVEETGRSFEIYEAPIYVTDNTQMLSDYSAFNYVLSFEGNMDKFLTKLGKRLARAKRGAPKVQTNGSSNLVARTDAALLEWWRTLPHSPNASEAFKAFFRADARAGQAAVQLGRATAAAQGKALTLRQAAEYFMQEYAQSGMTPVQQTKISSFEERIGSFGLFQALLDSPQEGFGYIFCVLFISAVENSQVINTPLLTGQMWQLLADVWTYGLEKGEPEVSMTSSFTAQWAWLLKLSKVLCEQDDDGLKGIMRRVVAHRFKIYLTGIRTSRIQKHFTDSIEPGTATGTKRGNNPADLAGYRMAMRSILEGLEHQVPQAKKWTPSNEFIDHSWLDPDQTLITIERNLNIKLTPDMTTLFRNNLHALAKEMNAPVENMQPLDHQMASVLAPLVAAMRPTETFRGDTFSEMLATLRQQSKKALGPQFWSAANAIMDANDLENRQQAVQRLVRILNQELFRESGYLVFLNLADSSKKDSWTLTRLPVEGHSWADWVVDGQDASIPVYDWNAKWTFQTYSPASYPEVGLVAHWNEELEKLFPMLHQILEKNKGARNLRSLLIYIANEAVQKLVQTFPLEGKWRYAVRQWGVHAALAEEMGKRLSHETTLFQPDADLQKAWIVISAGSSQQGEFPLKTWSYLSVLSTYPEARPFLLNEWLINVANISVGEGIDADKKLFFYAISRILDPHQHNKNFKIGAWKSLRRYNIDSLNELVKNLPSADNAHLQAGLQKMVRTNFQEGIQISEEKHQMTREIYPLLTKHDETIETPIIPLTAEEGIAEILKLITIPAHRQIFIKNTKAIMNAFRQEPRQVASILAKYKISGGSAKAIQDILKRAG